jgi:hypothetical protein
MEYTRELLKKYEDFLGSMKLSPEFFKIKDFEMDLKNELNPSQYLTEFYFNKINWLSFSDFFDFYFNKYKETIKERFLFPSYDNFSEGLRARLYRTQFGFLTEYHAFFLSSILFGSKNVFRSVQLDISGVDFRINLHEKYYNIHIFVDTERAWSYRNFKSKHKRVDDIEGIHTNLPYSLKQNKFNSLRFLKNGFGVYTESYLRFFESESKLGRIKNNNISGTTTSGFVYTH